MIELTTSHHFAMGREAASWVNHALTQSAEAADWDRVSDIIQTRGLERHGHDMRYDDGDVRYIIKIPKENEAEFLELLTGLAKRNADGDSKIIIGGAWKEPDGVNGQEGYYGVRVSQAVGMHLARETNLNRSQEAVISI